MQAPQVASDNSARKQRQLTLAFDESVKRHNARRSTTNAMNLFFQADDFDYDVLALIKKDVDGFLQQDKMTKAQIERYIFDNISYEAHFLPEKIDNAQTKEMILQLAQTELKRKADILKDPVQLRNFYRLCLLKAIDNSWIEEVDTLEQLKNLITARTSAQRNPVYEYHFEAKRAYQAMQANLRRLALQNLLLSTITVKKDGSLDVYFA